MKKSREEKLIENPLWNAKTKGTSGASTTKKCLRCGQRKQPNQFPLASDYDTESYDGLYPMCDICCILQDIKPDRLDSYIKKQLVNRELKHERYLKTRDNENITKKV